MVLSVFFADEYVAIYVKMVSLVFFTIIGVYFEKCHIEVIWYSRDILEGREKHWGYKYEENLGFEALPPLQHIIICLNDI